MDFPAGYGPPKKNGNIPSFFFSEYSAPKKKHKKNFKKWSKKIKNNRFFPNFQWKLRPVPISLRILYPTYPLGSFLPPRGRNQALEKVRQKKVVRQKLQTAKTRQPKFDRQNPTAKIRQAKSDSQTLLMGEL